jgi:hypothetical protein
MKLAYAVNLRLPASLLLTLFGSRPGLRSRRRLKRMAAGKSVQNPARPVMEEMRKAGAD